MKSILEYKGYHTNVKFDSESMTVRGKIEGITDYVDFETDNLSKVEEEFHIAVDDYLEFCQEMGKSPDKEYKGTFNVRVSPELHKELATIAFKEGDTLNATVEKAIKEYVSENHQSTMVG
jgi:predicted HicB family RNase H-like nuclease